ncbi:LysR substrate-binding domain-containing protein [Mesorhizobium kowhaii]|uniref:LysR family transcriptional regulator n=1 Tax=Mesorhizobium kowhaii TaxID=1300272 RepID=A0A2W7C8B2_9HYPH|nr:LysR substrate-binding domain-containing protein [Mesorhizobium kowhaii]PZV38561.1 LysR family transcriptional regulator [Mesorhizobium kowhaii]
MQDLNDLYFFAKVVEHKGFAPASRVLGIPKSTLSRRVSLLEERLGVRLLQRSTRRFAVTEIGQGYYRHCLAMVTEAEAAQEAVERVQAEPRGLIRVSCPMMLSLTTVAPLVSRFLAEHPRVQIHYEVTNRRVDVIEEGFDVALRVRMPPLESSDLVMKVLGESTLLLAGSPALLDRLGRPLLPADLTRFESLGFSLAGGEHAWRLTGPDGTVEAVPHQPRLTTDEMMTLRQAALDGVGIVQLPDYILTGDIACGNLEVLLPDWLPPRGIIHAVFPSRRGLLPAVRRFIDFLAVKMREP